MPIEPNADIWSAFLGACRIYMNEKMASQAYEIITKSGRDKTGIHVWDYLGARFGAFRWLLELGVGWNRSLESWDFDGVLGFLIGGVFLFFGKFF
ncbi:hypothetical protein ACS0TY_014471 [Phlomoides rotata]